MRWSGAHVGSETWANFSRMQPAVGAAEQSVIIRSEDGKGFRRMNRIANIGTSSLLHSDVAFGVAIPHCLHLDDADERVGSDIEITGDRDTMCQSRGDFVQKRVRIVLMVVKDGTVTQSASSDPDRNVCQIGSMSRLDAGQPIAIVDRRPQAFQPGVGGLGRRRYENVPQSSPLDGVAELGQHITKDLIASSLQPRVKRAAPASDRRRNLAAGKVPSHLRTLLRAPLKDAVDDRLVGVEFKVGKDVTESFGRML